LAAVGAAGVPIEPDQISIRLNNVLVAEAGAAMPDLQPPDLSARNITVAINLGEGRSDSHERNSSTEDSSTSQPSHDYFVWTTDLSAQYVHENSAYST
jgi:glutamate N-acetyltransferase/amino-acid N-acetyltransferase